MRRSRKRACQVCSSEIVFPADVWRSLKRLNEGEDGRNQREVGFLLKLSPAGDRRYTAEISHSSHGDGESVNVPRGSYGVVSAHGHHPGGYEANRVTRAWPSYDDFVRIHDRALDRRQNCLLHLVVALEGIYKVSLSPHAIKRGRKWLTKMGRKLDRYHRELPKIGTDDAHAHTKYVRDVRFRKGPFSVEHLSWPQNEKTPMTVTFSHPSCDGGKCVITGCRDSDM